MALTACPECSREVCDGAGSCLSCGCSRNLRQIDKREPGTGPAFSGRQALKTGRGCLFLMITAIVIFFLNCTPAYDYPGNSEPETSYETRPQRPPKGAISLDAVALTPGSVFDWRQASHDVRIEACEETVKRISRGSRFWLQRQYLFIEPRYQHARAAEVLASCISTAASTADATESVGAIADECMLQMEYSVD